LKLVAQGVKDSTFCEAVGVGTGEGVFVALAVGLATGAAFLTVTPLLHTNFLPDLMQVCFIAAYVIVCPCFEHAVPGFMAAFASGVMMTRKSALTAKSTTFLRIEEL
jgi:hypothetical protein